MATEPVKQTQAKADRNYADLAFDVVSVGLSAATGMLAAWYSAMRNFNNRTLHSMGLDRGLRSKRDKALSVLGSGSVVGEEFIKQEQAIYKEYHIAKDAMLAEKGINSAWSKFKLLDKYGKGETMLAFGAVTALALGTLMNLRGTRQISNHQQDLEDRLNAMENEKQR